MKLEEVLPHLRARGIIEDEVGGRYKLRGGLIYKIEAGWVDKFELDLDYDGWKIVKEKVKVYQVLYQYRETRKFEITAYYCRSKKDFENSTFRGPNQIFHSLIEESEKEIDE